MTDLLKIKCKALSERRYDKATWCDLYVKQIRDITDVKFMDVTSHLAIVNTYSIYQFIEF